MDKSIELSLDIAVAVNSMHISFGGEVPKQVLFDVDLRVFRATCTALVGESGSGKTTLGRAIASMLPARATKSGTVNVEGDVRYMLQDAPSALNPIRRVKWQLRQVLQAHGTPTVQTERQSLELLADVGIPNPALVMRQYPYELSGGLAQRVLLATVLATNPKILVVDEPTSALDVTTQDKIMKLFRHLIDVRGLTLILITHDIGAASRIADRVAVMRNGRIVEEGPVERLIQSPKEAYTSALIAASVSDEAVGTTNFEPFGAANVFH